jgi:hypothetical protein
MFTPRMRSALVPVLLTVASTSLGAQYSGTWTMRNAQGGVVTVTLTQDAQGVVAGTMSGAGTTYTIEGMLEEGIAVGAIYDQSGGVYFEAQVQDAELLLTLIEPGADNQPDYSRMRDLVLTRTTDAGGAALGDAAGNPLASGAAGARADPFAATFDGQGVQLVLEAEGGEYRGTLTFDGQSYPVAAMAAGPSLTGSFAVGNERYPFEAQLEGEVLVLVSGGNVYRLGRQATGNPLARRAAATERPVGIAEGLSGRWSCQSGEGPASLEFVSPTRLLYDGQPLDYQLGQGVLTVSTEWGPMDYRFDLAGDELQIAGADGTSLTCSRAAPAAQAPRAMAGGTGLERHLRGLVCSYSASPDGGFSTQHLLDFDGQGRVWYGVETAWDVPETTGVSRNWDNGENVGTYQVMGVNRGDAIQVQFRTSSGIARVVTVEGGEITELFLEGPDRHYSKRLCP